MFVENSNWLRLPGMMNDECHLPALSSSSRWKNTPAPGCFLGNITDAERGGHDILFLRTPAETENRLLGQMYS